LESTKLHHHQISIAHNLEPWMEPRKWEMLGFRLSTKQ
jgi:hypothetical protein